MMNPHAVQTGRHYEIILNSIADGVLTVDLDFRITSFNAAAEKITGIKKQQAVGKYFIFGKWIIGVENG